MPEGPTFGGGVAASLISPIALCMLVLFAVLILLLPRKYMILPFLLAIFLIPLNQQIFALGVHWLPNRIVVLIAFMRLLATGFIGDKPQTQRGWNGSGAGNAKEHFWNHLSGFCSCARSS